MSGGELERGVLDDLASLRREIAALGGRVDASARQGQDTAGSVQRLSSDVGNLARDMDRLSEIVEGRGSSSPGLKTELALIRQVVEALDDAAIPAMLTKLEGKIENLLSDQSEKRRGLWQLAASWGGQVIAFFLALLLAYATIRHATHTTPTPVGSSAPR